MKRILLISYYFPPIGMGGTQRMAAFARHLPKFGWEPTILTVKPIYYYAQDNSLLRNLAKVRIERTESLDPLRILYRLTHWRNQNLKHGKRSAPVSKWKKQTLRIINFFCIPDTKRLWNFFAYHRAEQLIKEKTYHAILSSGPPHSSHLIGYKLARKYRLPWIADFRDGWADGDFQPAPTFLHRKMNAILQKRILKAANAIVTVSSGLSEILQNSAAIPFAKMTVITNGFEGNDFTTRPKRDECFDVVHLGTVGNFVQPAIFLKAFKQFMMDANLTHEDAKLHFIGADLTGTLVNEIEKLGLRANVEVTGYLRHDKAIQRLCRADVLLYLINGNPCPGFVPGKTFEYLAAKRPIMAVSLPVEGLQILQEHSTLRWTKPNDFDGMVLALKAFFAEFKKREEIIGIANDLEKFSRFRLTEKFAKLLDEISG